MIAVIFEVLPSVGQQEEYIKFAADIRDELGKIDGFISVERFQSLSDPRKFLSLSFFTDEAAVSEWRNLPQHREAQTRGRSGIFADYRLRVADVKRDYGLDRRKEAPDDSRMKHE